VDPASDRAPDEVLTPLLAQIDVFQGRMLQVSSSAVG